MQLADFCPSGVTRLAFYTRSCWAFMEIFVQEDIRLKIADHVNTHMLSWMNFLILLLEYLSSLYFTELSSNLFASTGGRNRMTPLQTQTGNRHCRLVAQTAPTLF